MERIVFNKFWKRTDGLYIVRAISSYEGIRRQEMNTLVTLQFLHKICCKKFSDEIPSKATTYFLVMIYFNKNTAEYITDYMKLYTMTFFLHSNQH